MKKLLEIVFSLVLHPIAWVLMMVNLLGRDDLGGGQKVIWGVASLVLWGIGPISYILFAGGDLW